MAARIRIIRQKFWRERETIHRDVRKAEAPLNTYQYRPTVPATDLHMKTTLHIAILAAALIAIGFLADAWRSSRHDAEQLNTVLTSQNAAIQQADAREKQQHTELTAALAAITAQKRAVKTPQQAAQAIPSVLPPLPLPI